LETGISFKAANYTTLNIVRKSLVVIKIGIKEIKHECVIVGGICSLILFGMEVLKRLKVIINFDSYNIIFKFKHQSETFKLNVNNSFKISQFTNQKYGKINIIIK